MTRALAFHGRTQPPPATPVVVGRARPQPIDRETILLPEPMEGWVSELELDADGALDGSLEFQVRLPTAHAARGGPAGPEGWAGFFVSPTGSYIPGTDFRVVRMRDRWCAVCRWADARAERPPTNEVRLLPPVPGAPVIGARVSWPLPRQLRPAPARPPAPVDARVIVLWSVIDGALEFEVSWSDEARAEIAEGWTGVFLDEAGAELPDTEFAVLRIKDPRRALCRWAGARSTKLPSHDVRTRPPAAASSIPGEAGAPRRAQ